MATRSLRPRPPLSPALAAAAAPVTQSQLDAEGALPPSPRSGPSEAPILLPKAITTCAAAAAARRDEREPVLERERSHYESECVMDDAMLTDVETELAREHAAEHLAPALEESRRQALQEALTARPLPGTPPPSPTPIDEEEEERARLEGERSSLQR